MVMKDGVWRALAYATTCELDINKETVETGSKLTGRWRTSRARKLGWTISAGHLMADVQQEVDIMELVKSDKTVTVCMGSVEPHDETVTDAAHVLDGRLMMTGSAHVTRATVSAKNGDFVTISIALEGTGALTSAWAPWVLDGGYWRSDGVWMNHKVWG